MEIIRFGNIFTHIFEGLSSGTMIALQRARAYLLSREELQYGP